MKVTHLKIKGKKATEAQKQKLNKAVRHAFKKAGFITNVNFEFGTIGLRSKCFLINTEKLGYNARTDGGINGLGMRLSVPGAIVGFKKTSLPTWDQRVKFNNILNAVLDRFNATCKIISGPFLVRCHINGAQTERDWNPYENRFSATIEALTPDMEAEAKRIRKERAKQLRQIKKDKTKGNLVEVLINYGGKKHSQGVMTQTEYNDWRLQASTGDFAMHETVSVKPRLALVKE